MEVWTPVRMESPLGYHPFNTGILTISGNPVIGQYQVGSLTGAVASQRVTEAPKGPLRVDGNHPWSALAVRGLDCERDISSRDESRAK